MAIRGPGRCPVKEETDIRNSERIIRRTMSGGTVQTWRRDDRGWTENSSCDIERRATVEQLLSHQLPAIERGTRR